MSVTINWRLAATSFIALMATTVGAAEPAPRSVEYPIFRNAGAGVAAELRVYDDAAGDWRALVGPRSNGVPVLSVGQRVAVCVRAEETGFISIWSLSRQSAHPVRIYPNDYSRVLRATSGGVIGKQAEVCFGDGGGYRFEVVEPHGVAEIYVHWSAGASGQFGPADFPLIPEFNTRSSARTAIAYASRTITYTVRR